MKLSLFPSPPQCSAIAMFVATVLGTSAISRAQLATSGTPGDRAVYSIGAGATIADKNALPGNSLTYDFDAAGIVVDDTADSYELGADGGADDTKIFLTGGHHIVLYGAEFDGNIERSGLDAFIKVNGTKIPYGHSAGYSRDPTNRSNYIRGGTILNVAQGDSIEVESQRTDVFTSATDVGNRAITLQRADVQLIKLDDTNLNFLRLGVGTSSLLMPANDEGPVEVDYDVQDELDASHFDHSTTTNPEQITLKSTGHYLIFVNSGLNIVTGVQRNAVTQKLKLNGSPINGGATTVFLRHAAIGDTIGGLVDDGAVSVGVVVEVTSANSILTVELTRDNLNSDSSVSIDSSRTGVAIAKLPAYGEYITLNGGSQELNSAIAGIDLSVSSDVSNASFTYASASSASQVVVNKTDDYLFLASHHATSNSAASGARAIIEQAFRTNAGVINYGFGGAYNRDQHGTADAAVFSGTWAGAVLPLAASDTVETTKRQRGGAASVSSVSLGLQGINIASISALPAVPIITVNNIIPVSIGDPAVTIGTTELSTSHATDGPADLTYTLDSQPVGGTLKKSGTTLNNGDTFTQADIDSNLITFEAGGVETDPGGFDITVRDIAMNSDSGTVVIRVIQAISLAADSAATDEDTAITEAQLISGADLLSNDTGSSITVISHDAFSANGATVLVNPDGTFTYDPNTGNALQQLSGGGSQVDTFTYTVTDTIGKTATATVSVTVAGVNDATDAVNDFLFAGPLENDASYVSTRSLVGNDGVVRAPLVVFPAGSDLGLLPGKTVSQSPSTGTPPGNGFPGNAFDGSFSTFTHTDAVNNGSDHSWQVDFGHLVSLESLTIFNRTGCCAERLRDITVTVLDDFGANVFTSAVLNAGNVLGFLGASAGELSVNFGGPIMGQTVVITRATLPSAGDPGNESVLSLGEVTIIGSSPVMNNEDILLLNYDASQTANAGRWENLGSNSGSLMDWNLSGVTLNSSPGSARSQITAAYEWDNAADRAIIGDGVTNASIHDVMPGDPDAANATFEFWVKPANTSQVMTIFETGGGAGFGLIINNGVLEAATELDGATMNGSYVSYDLVADPAGLVGGNPTTEFNQYAVTITVNGGLQLFVNGQMVSETVTGVSADWDGGDGAGLGHFGEANHGGFQNAPPVSSTYDAPFIGAMAAMRMYSGVLTQTQIFQNYNAVTNGTDLDGDAISVTGVLDASNMLVGVGTPATLASGAQVTISNTSGHFTYNSNGVFDLLPGQTTTDSFGYRVTDGNGETADATVTLTITGEADILNDSLTAREGETKVYFANAFMGNDEFVSSSVSGAYINFTPPYASGGVWEDLGSRALDATITGSVILPQELESNFGPIGAGVTSSLFTTLDAISAADVTMEVWFKPNPGQTGKKTIFETGGNGTGYSLVYDPAANSVIASIDGGNDVTQKLQTSAAGVRTDEFNQVFVTIDINGGAEVGVASGIFEDIISIRLNNDPTAAFDATVDGTATATAGDVNDWSGTDGAATCAVNGTSALNENFPGMEGVVSIVRIYPLLLTPTEMEANFDDYAQPLLSVTSPSDVQGASVTLNADGSVTVDYSGVSLSPGQSVSDSFAYTSTAGSANVDVMIEAYSVLEDWRISYGLAPDGNGAGYDTDSLNELLEFAFGTDPTVDDADPMSVGSPTSFTPGTQIMSLIPPFNPTNVNAQFVRRKDWAAAGLTYTPQFSADLMTWEPDPTAPVPTVISSQAGDYEAVQVPYLVFTPDFKKATFYRILVEVSP